MTKLHVKYIINNSVDPFHIIGYVCPLPWVLPTGCCNTDHAVRFDCSSCLQTTDCCAVYEHCVSCCLRSDKVQHIFLYHLLSISLVLIV